MKKKIALSLLGLFGIWFAHASSTRTIQSDSVEGFFGEQNLVKNSGAETGTTLLHVESGGAFSTTSSGTNVARGDYSFTWDSVAANQTVRGTLVPIPAGLYGRDVEVSGEFQCPNGTCTHILEAWDGTTVLAQGTLISSSNYRKASADFTMPTSGSIGYRVKSVASNEPPVNFDSLFIGEPVALKTPNIAYHGYWAVDSACTGSSASGSNTAPTAFSTDADCPGPTPDMNGAQTIGDWQTTDADIPGVITVKNLPPGRYFIQYQVGIACGGNVNAVLAIHDGYRSSSPTPVTCQTASNASATVGATFVYTKKDVHTFQLLGGLDSGSITLRNSWGRTIITVWRYPTLDSALY